MVRAILNSNTTYGVDTFAGNNYGLGPNFRSTQALSRAQRGQASTPSWWWIIGFLLILAVV